MTEGLFVQEPPKKEGKAPPIPNLKPPYLQRGVLRISDAPATDDSSRRLSTVTGADRRCRTRLSLSLSLSISILLLFLFLFLLLLLLLLIIMIITITY